MITSPQTVRGRRIPKLEQIITPKLIFPRSNITGSTTKDTQSVWAKVTGWAAWAMDISAMIMAR